MIKAVVERMHRVGLVPGDVLWPSVLAVVGIIEIFVQEYTPYAVSVGCMLAGCAILTQRRAHPYLALVGLLAAYGAAPLLGFDVSESAVWVLLQVLGCFAVGRYLPRTALVWGFLAVVAFVMGTGLALIGLTDFAPDIFFGAIFGIAPWVLGLTVRVAEDRAITVTREFERARTEELLEAERSIRQERDQIAREIHDVLAHSLSLMIVQAQVAETSLVTNPAAAEEATGEVQKAGRSALDEVGRLVRLIRREGSLDDIGPLDRVHADLEGSIRDLTEDVARAGQPVTFSADLNGGLPAAMEVTVFRVVQEALTNALKHAPGAPTRVLLRGAGDAVEVQVSNERANSISPGAATGGHGLAGLQERVDLFGGSLAYGPDAAGGFDVRVSLPIGAASA